MHWNVPISSTFNSIQPHKHGIYSLNMQTTNSVDSQNFVILCDVATLFSTHFIHKAKSSNEMSTNEKGEETKTITHKYFTQSNATAHTHARKPNNEKTLQ